MFKRIPGVLLSPSKRENQGYIEDLTKLQKFELEELLQRQDQLLNRKSLISKLSDNGAKIKDFRKRITEELKRRQGIEETANLLSKLNIVENGKFAMSELEWTGKYSEEDVGEKLIELGSDDEENPMKILAQMTGSGTHRKKVIHLQSDEKLIKYEDLEDSNCVRSKDPIYIGHFERLMNITENTKKDLEGKKVFKPYRTTKSNVHHPKKEKMREKCKNWEVTAATPPPIVHDKVQTLSLGESLKLQQEQAVKLHLIQTKYAVSRLAEQFGMHSLGDLPDNAGNYRTRDDVQDSDVDSESDVRENEEHEVYDGDGYVKGEVVVHTIHESNS